MYDHRAQIILRFWISKAIVKSSTATSVVSNLKVACQIDGKRIETYIQMCTSSYHLTIARNVNLNASFSTARRKTKKTAARSLMLCGSK
jgi:hypothetical protein